MKESIKDGIRVLFKTGVSAAAAYLTAKGIEVDANFVGAVVATGAGVANWVLNRISSALLSSERVPELIKAAVRFVWLPPEYNV